MLVIGDLAPVPLTVLRSHSKFDENWECSRFKYAQRITSIFCTRHDSYTDMCKISLWLDEWHVQNFVVIGRMCFEQEHCKVSLYFKLNPMSLVGREPGVFTNLNSEWFASGNMPLFCNVTIVVMTNTCSVYLWDYICHDSLMIAHSMTH